MSGEVAEFVYMCVGVMALVGTLAMLRVLASYRERIIMTHDMAREVQRIRAEYLKRLMDSRALEEAAKK